MLPTQQSAIAVQLCLQVRTVEQHAAK